MGRASHSSLPPSSCEVKKELHHFRGLGGPFNTSLGWFGSARRLEEGGILGVAGEGRAGVHVT